jgi:hypothetical protein
LVEDGLQFTSLPGIGYLTYVKVLTLNQEAFMLVMGQWQQQSIFRSSSDSV